jgi:hypothetical protein
MFRRMSGTFSVDNLPARQFAASLLSMFDNVMVITLPADQSSLFIAGRVLPFDDAHLLELLEANGASPFVVYDTPAVQIIVGKVQPVAGK